jgi:Glycosyl transferases group 1/Glycosyl transferase 4-like
MRILFVVMIEDSHTARWIGQLSGENWDIHVFPYAEGHPHAQLRNVTMHRLFQLPSSKMHPSVRQAGIPWPFPRGGGRLAQILGRVVPNSMSQQARLARTIRAVKPDIIHVLEMQRAGYLLLGARNHMGGCALPPLIYSSWGSDIFCFGQQPQHAPRIREFLALCDYYIADCERDVPLAREFGFRGEVLGVFPGTGGFDISHMQSLAEPGAVSSRRVIAVKGYQGVEYGGRALVALEALRLCTDVLTGYEVVIYSASEPVRETARQLADSIGISVHVLPPSAPDEVARLMGRARVAIGIGTTDGIPCAMLEAMIMGAFPVQSDTVSTAEWIKAGENGFLVPPENAESIAVAIRRALADDSLVDHAAVINREITAKLVDQDVLRPRIAQMYREVGNGRKGRRAVATEPEVRDSYSFANTKAE